MDALLPSGPFMADSFAPFQAQRTMLKWLLSLRSSTRLRDTHSAAMDSRAGRLFVLSGPSGVGKDALIKAVLPLFPRLVKSVSVTTRPPGPHEEQGRSYRFVSPEEFQRLIDEGVLLEWAVVHGHQYGTPKAWVLEQLQTGRDVIVNIDVQGALAVRDKRSDAVLIFVRPPSLAVLRERLRNRGRDDEETVARRMKAAEAEMALASRYDYQLVNDNLEQTAGELAAVIGKEAKRRC